MKWCVHDICEWSHEVDGSNAAISGADTGVLPCNCPDWSVSGVKEPGPATKLEPSRAEPLSSQTGPTQL